LKPFFKNPSPLNKQKKSIASIQVNLKVEKFLLFCFVFITNFISFKFIFTAPV